MENKPPNQSRTNCQLSAPCRSGGPCLDTGLPLPGLVVGCGKGRPYCLTWVLNPSLALALVPGQFGGTAAHLPP